MDDHKPRNTDKNSGRPPYPPEDEGGVYYTPSHARAGEGEPGAKPPHRPRPPQSGHNQAGYSAGRPSGNAPQSQPPRRKLPAHKQKSQFAVFFITTIFVGTLVLVILFALAWRSVANKRDDGGIVSQTPLPSASASAPPLGAVANKPVTALITGTSPDSQLTLYDLTADKSYSVYANGSTDLKDKFGNAMVFAEFKEGDIVEAAFGETDNLLSSMQSSPQAWKYVTGIKVDSENKTITIANTAYRYTNALVTVHNGSPFSLTELDPVDIVTVKGYKDTAWYVELDKSHGTIVIEKRPDILGGTVEIDTSIYASLDQTQTLKVTEGTHRVVVKGNNIEPFTTEVTISTGQEVTVDLSGIQLKAGIVTFNISEPDAKLTINEESMNPRDPLVLDYGEYIIKITKDGFADWERTITLDTPNYTVTAALEKIVEVCDLTITTDPAGAHIYIDNAYIGLSPVTTSIEYGLKTITVKKEGYVEISFPQTINTPAYSLPITLSPATVTVPSPTAPPIVSEEPGAGNPTEPPASHSEAIPEPNPSPLPANP